MRHMTLVEIALKRLRNTFGLRIAAVLLGAAVALPLAADPRSDVFQPDAFRTGASLRERTPGLTDPSDANAPCLRAPSLSRRRWTSRSAVIRDAHRVGERPPCGRSARQC